MVGGKFSKQTQQRQLVPAMLARFTDPFPPCRIKAAAALAAIVKDGYDPVELATKILPGERSSSPHNHFESFEMQTFVRGCFDPEL